MAAKKKSANQRAKTPVIALRLRSDVVARAEEIAKALGSSPHHRAMRASGDVDRSYVLRWAIERGLDEIAREVDSGTGPTAARPASDGTPPRRRASAVD